MRGSPAYSLLSPAAEFASAGLSSSAAGRQSAGWSCGRRFPPDGTLERNTVGERAGAKPAPGPLNVSDPCHRRGKGSRTALQGEACASPRASAGADVRGFGRPSCTVMLNMPLVMTRATSLPNLQHQKPATMSRHPPPRPRRGISPECRRWHGPVSCNATPRWRRRLLRHGSRRKQTPPSPLEPNPVELVGRDGGDVFDPIQHFIAEVHRLVGG
jgi:hypothetical protein